MIPMLDMFGGDDAGVEEESAEAAIEGVDEEIESTLRADAEREEAAEARAAGGGRTPMQSPPTAEGVGEPVAVRWDPDDLEPLLTLTWGTGWELYGRHVEEIEGFEFPDEIAEEVGEDLAEDLAPILDELLPRHAQKAKYVSFAGKVATYVGASVAAVKAAKAEREAEERDLTQSRPDREEEEGAEE